MIPLNGYPAAITNLLVKTPHRDLSPRTQRCRWAANCRWPVFARRRDSASPNARAFRCSNDTSWWRPESKLHLMCVEKNKKNAVYLTIADRVANL